MNDRPRRRHACIDRIVLFANHVLVEGWSVPPFDQAELVVECQGRRRAATLAGVRRTERHDVAQSLLPSGLPRNVDSRLGFIAALHRSAWPDLATDASTRWVIFADGQELAEFIGPGATIGRLGGDPQPDAIQCIITAGATGLMPADLVRLATSAFGGFEGVPRLEAHLDAVVRSGLGLAADGWVANAARRSLVFLTDDGAGCVAAGDSSFCARQDVSQHLKGRGMPVTTEDHGVIAVFPYDTDARQVIIGAFEDGRLVGHFVAAANANADVAGLFARLNAVEGGGRFVPPAVADRLYRPFLHEPPKEEGFSVHEVKPLSVKPDLSIIVPFYKEDMFIRHLTTMQMWFSETVEWIFVCDDPSLKRSLDTYLRRRAPLLRNRTRLVINHANYGYGPSNNIGASIADGDTLLFMNSDIWVDDAGPLERAVSALDSGEFGAIGFRLLYEDGTIQHDGLAFVRHSDVHDLFLVEHPGKGLPPEPAGDLPILPAPAATGALLMVGRDLFRKVGGFDDRYVRGDFEDADLCLRIAELGLPTGIVRDGGIYHLERQSIRLMGEVSFREVVMYLNCITFNERWGKVIAGGAAHGELLPNPANANAARLRELQVAE